MWECIVVPGTSFSEHLSHNGHLITGHGAFGISDSKLVPGVADFAAGQMLNTSSTVCAGLVVNADGSTGIGLCQTFYYNAGIGRLILLITTLPILQALSFPALMTSLGLPLRWYMLVVTPGLVGLVIQMVFLSQGLLIATAAQTGLSAFANVTDQSGSVATAPTYVSILGIVCYISCVYSTYNSEAYNRSLFTVQRLLNEQKAELVNKKELLKYVLYCLVLYWTCTYTSSAEQSFFRIAGTLGRWTCQYHLLCLLCVACFVPACTGIGIF